MKSFFLIILSSLAFISCELDGIDVVDNSSEIPVLIGTTVSPVFINTAGYPQSNKTIDTTLLLTASLAKSYPGTVAVHYVIEDPDESVIATGTLSDNGKGPDQIGFNGTYTAQPLITFSMPDLGKYTVSIYASNTAGDQSILSATSLMLFNSNNTPPQLSELDVPDTVFVPSGSTPSIVRVSVMVADSQGIEDIVSVTLRSVRPDSTVAGLFPLYDDGSSSVRPTFNIVSGDSVANDGRYTLTIPIFSDTRKKEFRDFIFTATDRSGTVSNTIITRVHIE